MNIPKRWATEYDRVTTLPNNVLFEEFSEAAVAIQDHCPEKGREARVLSLLEAELRRRLRESGFLA